jgi:spore maturation protein CgeB
LLQKNLSALQASQPDLHERLLLPVDGDHLQRDSSGAWTYRIQSNEFCASLTSDEARKAVSHVDPSHSEDLWIFGVGLGELLQELLERCPQANLVAWERDPWVMRQALAQNDFSAALSAGRLQLAMNADLGLMLEQSRPDALVLHPLFARLYNNERLLLDADLSLPRALVCCGTLFVESLASALRAEGYNVFSFDVERQSAEELQLVMDSWRPELVAGINHVQGLSEFCEENKLSYLCWEIDPSTDVPQPVSRPVPSTQIFTFRRANVLAYEQAGYEGTRYMPLAADPQRRRPMSLNADQRIRYAAPVSFVGASMVSQVEPFLETFQAQFEAWSGVRSSRGTEVIAQVLAEQRMDFSEYKVPVLLERELPDFRGYCASLGQEDPALLLAEVAAAEKRLNYLAELAPYNLVVWGDEGWDQLSAHGVVVKGPALHESELPMIYGGSLINVDVGRLYQSDIITMRVFDILACGGFVLAEHSTELELAFEVGVEIESYRTMAELKAKVAHFLAHPEAARAIAERGRQAVLDRHTIHGRVREMLDGLKVPG